MRTQFVGQQPAVLLLSYVVHTLCYMLQSCYRGSLQDTAVLSCWSLSFYIQTVMVTAD